uniref:hypothetical protein n=1 Tax=Streptomyces achromogenes TaxID=67255 RepID=UPI003F4994DB
MITEPSGVDLARQALVAARETAKKNGTTQTKKPTRRPGTVARRDGREPLGLGTAIGMMTTERGMVAPAAGGSALAQFDDILAAAAPELAGHVQAVKFDADTGRLDVAPDAPAYATQLRWSAPTLIAAAKDLVVQDRQSGNRGGWRFQGQRVLRRRGAPARPFQGVVIAVQEQLVGERLLVFTVGVPQWLAAVVDGPVVAGHPPHGAERSAGCVAHPQHRTLLPFRTDHRRPSECGQRCHADADRGMLRRAGQGERASEHGVLGEVRPVDQVVAHLAGLHSRPHDARHMFRHLDPGVSGLYVPAVAHDVCLLVQPGGRHRAGPPPCIGVDDNRLVRTRLGDHHTGRTTVGPHGLNDS